MVRRLSTTGVLCAAVFVLMPAVLLAQQNPPVAGSRSSNPPAALTAKLPLWVPITILVVLLAAVSIESHVLVLTHTVIEHAVYLLS